MWVAFFRSLCRYDARHLDRLRHDRVPESIQQQHDALGWLPERFHEHDFQWAADADGSRAPLIDDCLACHLGRSLVRLAPPAPALPDAPSPSFAGAPRDDSPAPTRTDFLSAPRAPPAS